MRCKLLYILLFSAIMGWKCSESASIFERSKRYVGDYILNWIDSASSSTKSKDASDFYIDENYNDKIIEGSGAVVDGKSSKHGDLEDTNAKGEDDEDSDDFVTTSSGSGFVDPSFLPELLKPEVTITKPPKNTKKPIIENIKPQPTKPPHTKPGKPYYSPEERGENVVKNPAATSAPPLPTENQPDFVPDNNQQSNNVRSNTRLMEHTSDKLQTSFFARPGILFAVVGGAVVGLLCAILLVMFIVYRMRKKDEGSYPLDEPRRSLNGNSYMRPSGKEFYA